MSDPEVVMVEFSEEELEIVHQLAHLGMEFLLSISSNCVFLKLNSSAAESLAARAEGFSKLFKLTAVQVAVKKLCTINPRQEEQEAFLPTTKPKELS